MKDKGESRSIIVIPSLNPTEKIFEIVDCLAQRGYSDIIIVNDGSRPEYEEIFRDLANREGIVVLTHFVNQGKGRALKTAFNYILNHYQQSGEGRVITVDGDGQHKIDDIVACDIVLSQQINDNVVVLGCRNFGESESIPFRSRFGNSITKIILSYLCKINVSDSQTGLRGFPIFMLPRLMSISGERYEYETNVLLELVEEGCKFIEVPILAVYEDNNSSSHFNPLLDSIKIYGVILKYSVASLLATVLDYVTFIILLPYCTSIWIITFLGRAVAAFFNFSINRKIVFRNTDSLTTQVFRYLCLLFVSGSISAALVTLGNNLFSTNIIFLKVIVEILLYFMNFYIQKNFIFKKNKRDGANES